MAAKDKMFSLRLPDKLLEEYRKFCDENSINISKGSESLWKEIWTRGE